MVDPFDSMWLLICTVLVVFMQAGFTCLEAGMTRSRNSISVAAKNLLDGGVTFILFWVVGYGLTFGEDVAGVFGMSHFFFPGSGAGPADISRFVFYAFFCCTTSTIISGAVAERMGLNTYVWVVVLISLLFFPVCGHLIWAAEGWLKQVGFVDFAGSTVVHSTGGWIALVLVWLVGPRTGRFARSGETWKGSQLPLSVLGVIILAVGWIGFNGGSTMALDDRVWTILLNTLMAIFGGVISALLLGRFRYGYYPLRTLLCAPLAGAAASSAMCPWLTVHGAILLGIIAGVVAQLIDDAMIALHLDDAVGAVPVHLGGGVTGTLVGAFLVDISRLDHDSHMALFNVQLLGSAVHGVFVVGGSLLLFGGLRLFLPLRVSGADEEAGLNVCEHRSGTELGDFVSFLAEQREQDPGCLRRARVDAFTEVGLIAHEYNLMLNQLSQREQALVLARELAERASEAKDKFLSHMSHELRTPLTTIIGYSELLQEDLQDSGFKEDAGTILKSARYLLTLINDILDVARIEAGKLELAPSWTRFPAFLNELEATVRPLVERRRNRLTVNCSVDEKRLLFDPIRLKQVLINLLSNAAKFTEDGEITVEIKKTDDGLGFLVRDTGRGMSEEECRIIFQEFEQVQRADGLAGTGLGLTITRRLVNMMGGTIDVESSPGKGSCFRFAIRAGSDLGEAGPAASGAVLVLEDDEDIRDYIKYVLVNAGYEVAAFSRGQEALAWARSGVTIRGMIIDYILPDGNGARVIEELKGEGVDCPSAIVTGFSGEIPEGVADFLIKKPFKGSDFNQLLLRMQIPGNHAA